MKFLVDNPLSPLVAEMLRDEGHDAVHVVDYQMHTSTDAEILERAVDEGRVIVSADTDFGTLLAKSGDTKPTVIIIRWQGSANDQAALLLPRLTELKDALEQGCIAIIQPDQVRIRHLPITS